MAKYFQLIMGIMMPESKSSCRKLRGNLLQIKYHDGVSDCYAMLPYCVPSKKWDRVIAQVKIKGGEDELIDVTEKILMVSGPGKDFFGVKITPKKLSRNWRSLMFHYPRKRKMKLFKVNEIITGL